MFSRWKSGIYAIFPEKDGARYLVTVIVITNNEHLLRSESQYRTILYARF